MKTMYYGGTVLTLEDKMYAEAILINEGKIEKTGSEAELKPLCDESVDLGGATLMPAFIDAHSHITSYASTLSFANLNELATHDDITEAFRRYLKSRDFNLEEWIIGFGYESNMLAGGMFDKRLLDTLDIPNPVIAVNKSGHSGVVNSAGLARMGEICDVEGGKVGRYENGEPDGYFEEQAFIPLSKYIPSPNRQELAENIGKAQKAYAACGITTVQDGKLDSQSYALLKNSELFIDVVGYADITAKNPPDSFSHSYQNHLRLGGYKMFLDGSPQARTAWMSEPYKNGEYGYPVIDEKTAEKYVSKALKNNTQILCHCNGDAAAQCFIDVCSRTNAKKVRPVMIHAQFLRPEQMQDVKNCGIIPSFFAGHIWEFADIHLENVGERANKISPMGSAQKLDVVFTMHSDTPVMPPDMLLNIHCAVNRVTKSGKCLDKGECISPLDALKAVTVNAAYQYFEENEKGTLKEGKRADMVILSQNPLECDKDKIKDIKILKTLKDGKVVYQA